MANGLGGVAKSQALFERKLRSTCATCAALLVFGCGSEREHDQAIESTSAAVSTIAFVQGNYQCPQSSPTSVVVPFSSAQVATDLNVVIVGWNDATALVSSVADTKGNVYTLAVGPTIRTGALTQSIYYAKNIVAAAAGANSVTVTFNRSASFPDVRVLEYSGVDPTSPFDVGIGANGSSASSNSGSVTTHFANEVLVGGNMVATSASGAGASYTSRMITSPDGDIAEDRVVAATASYNAVAPLSGAGNWVMQMAAFKAAGSAPDTQAPTAPTNLVATASSTTQIGLSWTASTDNVGVTNYMIERCTGSGCSTFAQIGTATAVTYNDTGLSAGTSYSYRVRATDAAANLSAYSGTASATTLTPDTQAPTAPSNLTATATSTTQINLSWTAATDNVAVTSYLIERCTGAGCSSFAQIATATGTTFNNTGLTASTSYSYRVRASDAANNLSSYSSTASATTQSAPDTQAPTAPSALSAMSVSTSQVNLSWTASTDNVGVTSYLVERCQGAGCSSFAQIGTSTGTSYGDTGLTASTSYSYRVRASDAAGNRSGYSNTASATTQSAPDTQAPTAPSNLSATAPSSTQINLSWTAATDNVGVSGYAIERCQDAGCSAFAQVGTSTGTSFNDTGLAASTNYSYRVRASDAAGNLSPYSNTATATTQAPPDTQAPSAPADLAVTVASMTQIALTWTASTDNVGVTGYLVERCTGASCSAFAQIGTSSTASYSDATVIATNAYSYRVRARDAANNSSAYSSVASSTPIPDTTAPSAPGTLNASAVSSSQINLTWTAASDDVGVVSYAVERCQGASCSNFAPLISVSSLSYSDNALSATTSYSYRVRASDAAGNSGPYSIVASATTQAVVTTPPAFVQGKFNCPQSSPTSVAAAYTNAQTAGNFNVVIIGWNDTTAVVSTVADTKGNLYQLAVGPTLLAGSLSQSIYYAKNIATAAAGANTVTVTFNRSASFPDIRILEYSGVDTVSPFDVGVGATGNNATSSSGSATSHNANELIVAGNMVATSTTGAGSGFTSRMISSPDGDIAEDRIAATAGAYTASAPLSGGGGWVMQMAAFKGSAGSAPDTQAPTAPTNLVATASSATQIGLSWTASTDNVGVTNYLIERCQGAGCSSFAQIGTSPSASFSDSGLTASTSYSYRVRATDAANNLGAYSSTASATTQTPGDTQAPTAPSGLAVTTVSMTQIALTWTGSTDNVGVTAYLIERCQGAGCSSFAQIATSATASYTDNAVTATNSYSYRVRARDAANNLSGYSNSASSTVIPDTQPPSAPSNLGANALSSSQIALSWSAASDDVGVAGYLIERCQGAGCSNFASLISVTGLSYTDSGLSATTPYSYRVQAADAAGNLGPYSNVAGATTLTTGTAGLVAGYALNEGSGTTTADVSTNHINGTLAGGAGWGVGEYGNAVSLNGSGQYVDLGNPTALQLTGSMTVSAWINAAGFPSDDAAVVSKRNTTGFQFDTTVDTGPRTVGFKLTTGSGNDAFRYGMTTLQTARWYFVAGVYNAAAQTIDVYVDGQLDSGAGLGVATGSQQNSNQNVSIGRRTGQSGYEFNGRIDDVRIYNRALSKAEIQADMSTALAIVASDPTPPTAPSNLAVTVVSPTQSSSSWTGSTDNVAVTHYLLERCAGNGCSAFVQIADVAGTSYSDSALAPLTSYSYRVRAGDAAGNRSGYSNVSTITTPDWQPPSVSVTSPSSGATLSGQVNVSVSASGPNGVSGVQLVVDDMPVALPDATSPYSLPLNSAKFANGNHTLSAYAWSNSGKLGYASAIPVTFSNASPGNPAHDGMFSGSLSLPIVSVHSHLLPGGRILMSDAQDMGGNARTWDPVTGFIQTVDAPVNIFCAGHEQMADGRIFVAGGHIGAHVGLTAANVFDPATNTWTVLPDMQEPRWYPTVTTLSDGRIFVLAGETSCAECEALIPEIYSPATNTWAHLNSAQFSFPYYPHVFELADGRLFVPATAEDPIVSQVLDLNTSSWNAVGGAAVDGGSTVMYLPGKFLKTGTSTDPDDTVRNSAATAYVLDMTQGSPTWRQVASMAKPRTYHTPTMLPDGTVLITGGGPTTAATDINNATLPIELWSPTSETFTTLGSMNVPRLYHSEAILLPDARIAILGGGRWDGVPMPTDQLSAELYLPPYLFKGPRPTITSAPAALQLGQNFTVQTPDASRIASVSLIRFASVTHSVNMGQRYLPLSFTAGSGSLTVSAPSNAHLAAPGNYMLFLVDTNGVPSLAAITKI